MKVLYMAVAITVLSVGQRTSEPIAGSWTATFEGRTYVRLEIKTVDGAIAGGISLGNLETPLGKTLRHQGAQSRFVVDEQQMRYPFGSEHSANRLTQSAGPTYPTDKTATGSSGEGP